VADNSAIARAIDYSPRRWAALSRYAESGDLPIDNNPIENAIWPIALGKKNCLFAGSERAGKRAAAIQTLLGTAKLNGIEPYAWRKKTLEKLPTWPNSRIDELLPIRVSRKSLAGLGGAVGRLPFKELVEEGQKRNLLVVVRDEKSGQYTLRLAGVDD
jgi:hypothetical protein